MPGIEQIAMLVGGTIYVLLGGIHGIWTLGDVKNPKKFTPVDDAVREAMQGVPIALHPQTDMWRAWLGFNLSHSLGLVIFGGLLSYIALLAPALISSSWILAAVSITTSICYMVMSYRFWFIKPLVGSGIATLCIVAAFLLS